MLTDYHVHLRSDDVDSRAEDAFSAANAERYREVASERGIAELGVAEHVHRFTAALDVWQHPFWRASATDDIDAYVSFVREDTDLKLGIEADFVPGREDRMATLLDAHEEDLKEDRVDDDLQNRILELQQKDTLSEDEEKELDVLTHLKEALDAEVRRRIES